MSTSIARIGERMPVGKRALAALLLAMFVWAGAAVAKGGPKPSVHVRTGNSWGRMMAVYPSPDEVPVS